MQILKTDMSGWQMLSVVLEEGEALEPEAIASLSGLLPDVDLAKGVILDGKMPGWMLSHLTARFGMAKWVAANDPKLKGAVVVKSHDNAITLGSIQSTALIV